MTYADTVIEDRRLLILRCLENAAVYSAGVPLIRRFLASMGHEPSADQVATDLAWLGEQGLIAVTQGAVPVAHLNDRGLDVAQGRAIVPGVRRPGPGE